MAWKGVHITKPARLSLARNQLSVTQEDGETTIALEDIAWIVADDHRITLSVALLAACADSGVAIIISDARHMPCGLALPFHTHHRTAAIASLQIAASLPLKKQLWQSVIRAKIANQASVLDRLGSRHAKALLKMAGRVRSGDRDNTEARAAREYWSALFDNFTRSNAGDLRNKALNYSYAVVRGCIARALVASGFVPAIGLHHNSITNPFNLADDMIEPFRPIADFAVYTHLKGHVGKGDLKREDRQALAATALCQVDLCAETLGVLHASEMVAQSLVRAFETNDADKLKLPSFPSMQPAFPDMPV